MMAMVLRYWWLPVVLWPLWVPLPMLLLLVAHVPPTLALLSKKSLESVDATVQSLEVSLVVVLALSELPSQAVLGAALGCRLEALGVRKAPPRPSVHASGHALPQQPVVQLADFAVPHSPTEIQHVFAADCQITVEFCPIYCRL